MEYFIYSMMSDIVNESKCWLRPLLPRTVNRHHYKNSICSIAYTSKFVHNVDYTRLKSLQITALQ